jgi:F-type H+-transporting ATPase subunit beta
MATATEKATKVGKVVQVIGPVVDVEFAGGHLPSIYNAVRIVSDDRDAGDKIDVVAEVEQHLGENRVRTVAMKPTDGMRRGMTVIDTGAPISMPVGQATLGTRHERARRAGRLPGSADPRRGALVDPPRGAVARGQSTELQMFETGIKVVDLLEPYLRGGKIGLFGGAGVGKTVIIQELITTSP